MGHIDSGTNKSKFGSTLEVVGDHTDNTQQLTLKWSDTDHITFTSSRAVELSRRHILTRIGKYNRRTYQIEYSGEDTLRLESLEYNINEGSV